MGQSVARCPCLFSVVNLSNFGFQALVDVAASEGWLGPVLQAMLLVQMTVQGCWHWDSSLLGLPALCQDHLTLLSRAMPRSMLALLHY